MASAGLEPAIPASERPQTHALDRGSPASSIIPQHEQKHSSVAKDDAMKAVTFMGVQELDNRDSM